MRRVARKAQAHLEYKLEHRPARESRRKTRGKYGRRLDDWTYGALYTGMMAYVRLIDDSSVEKTLLKVAEAENYEPGSRLDPYHADDHAICQLYTELYFRHGKAEMLDGTRKRFEKILTNPSEAKLRWHSRNARKRWSWADALFMAPPAWIQMYHATGEKKYLDFLAREWKATTDYLFDPRVHLYYRDSSYFPKDGQARKIFWSRGVGWAFAGNARILEYLPKDHPDYPRHVEVFRKLAARIVKIQKPDGLWSPSLLEADRFPAKETSGSAFHCFALAWGINHGLLDARTYRPAAIRAWQALVDCVDEDGVLRHVQPPGAAPERFPPDSSAVYATGAFLLAGSEIHELLTPAGPGQSQTPTSP
jgi:rhamnogalacturonyl hydrolase YesR